MKSVNNKLQAQPMSKLDQSCLKGKGQSGLIEVFGFHLVFHIVDPNSVPRVV